MEAACSFRARIPLPERRAKPTAAERDPVDTIKVADLGRGEMPGSIVLDFNFAENPSCADEPEWYAHWPHPAAS
jgi:uncharacterized protein (DUF1684 family)